MAALEAASEHNVVRLILPREPGGRVRGPLRASRAHAGAVAGRRASCGPTRTPALYVYEQAAPDGHVQRGLVGALGLTPAEDGIVLPHENTIARAVGDRLALYEAVGADLEPIFLVHDGGGAAAAAVAAAGTPDGPALVVDAELADGLRHRVWAITDPDVLQAVAQDLLPRRALIADGHHRYATYLQRQAGAPRGRRRRRARGTSACACSSTRRPSGRRCTRSTGSCPACCRASSRSARRRGMAVRRLEAGRGGARRRAGRARPRPGAPVRPSCWPPATREELHLLSEPDPAPAGRGGARRTLAGLGGARRQRPAHAGGHGAVGAARTTSTTSATSTTSPPRSPRRRGPPARRCC